VKDQRQLNKPRESSMSQQVQQRYLFGDLLREWREARKVTQMHLANRAEVSPRHLSFVENGRSAPSRGMVIRLAEHLDVPLRGRNQMLLAAGYAPEYSEGDIQSPQLSMVMQAIRKVLQGHDPYPAVVVSRDWNLLDANASVALMTEGVPQELLAPPCNVLRLTLHPQGLAPRILNLPEWRDHVMERLERQIRSSGSQDLTDLYRELSSFGAPTGSDRDSLRTGIGDVVVPMRLRHGDRVLSLFSTVTMFGTPRDITVEELAIESFYPADAETADYLREASLASRT
jgi:transcriptional regulator with XRE-family HTH domain